MAAVETKAPTGVGKFPLTTLMAMVVVAAYALKLGASGETYEVRPRKRARQLFVAGPGYVLHRVPGLRRGPGLPAPVVDHLCPGTVLFVMSRREQNRRYFSPIELVVLVITVAGFISGVAALATGAITI